MILYFFSNININIIHIYINIDIININIDINIKFPRWYYIFTDMQHSAVLRCSLQLSTMSTSYCTMYSTQVQWVQDPEKFYATITGVKIVTIVTILKKKG